MAPKTVILDLGAQSESIERRVQSGQYEDVNDVIRSAMRALDREDAALDAVLRDKIKSALGDRRPSIPAAQVFKKLRARHSRKVKAAGRGA